MTEKEQADYASARGYRPLGTFETVIRHDLTDAGRIKMGEQQSEALLKAAAVEREKAAVTKKLQAEIDEQYKLATDAAIATRDGYTEETIQAHVFLDFILGRRVYTNELGVQVKNEPMNDSDRQMRLVNG